MMNDIEYMWPNRWPAAEKGQRVTPYRQLHCIAWGFALALTTLCDSWAAGPGLPGEGSGGVLYTITHLPLGAYLVLCFILMLSVANLMYQFRIAHSFRPGSVLRGLLGQGDGQTSGGWRLSALKWPRKSGARIGHAHRPTSISKLGDLSSDGVLAVRKAPAAPDTSPATIPTPLDGMNHPLPQFSAQGKPAPESPSDAELKADQEVFVPEFKFNSAVDLPSKEELVRREREQLVVAGSILGPDGEGIDSVVVYLEDEGGNRIGQSCRSAADTGEFKVLANEPGRYFLKAYKRGLLMEDAKPGPLPIEAGKIEGYTIRLVPEGCLIQGRVINRTHALLGPQSEVRLHVGSQQVPRSVLIDSDGGFRVRGVPGNSQCRIQVVDEAGKTLAFSDWFSTSEKKEILMNVTITESPGAQTDSSSPGSDPKAPEKAEADASPRPSGSVHSA